jgi:hypothetical protein
MVQASSADRGYSTMRMNLTGDLLATFRALDINYTVCEFLDKIANSTIAASSAGHSSTSGPRQLLLPDVRIALGIAWMKSCHVNRKKLQGLES